MVGPISQTAPKERRPASLGMSRFPASRVGPDEWAGVAGTLGSEEFTNLVLAAGSSPLGKGLALGATSEHVAWMLLQGRWGSRRVTAALGLLLVFATWVGRPLGKWCELAATALLDGGGTMSCLSRSRMACVLGLETVALGSKDAIETDPSYWAGLVGRVGGRGRGARRVAAIVVDHLFDQVDYPRLRSLWVVRSVHTRLLWRAAIARNINGRFSPSIASVYTKSVFGSA